MADRVLSRPVEWAAFVVLWLTLLTALGAGTTSCSYTCTDNYTCEIASTGGGGTGGESPCPEDPRDGQVAPECGVWVSASFGDDANPGTQAAPVKTITAGVVLAQQDTMRVYVCGETFNEAVFLVSGISLFGGFDCQNDWRYLGTEKRALIQPDTAGAVPLTLLEGDRMSSVRDVNVTAPDAVDPGGSSIGMFALAGSRVDIRRAHITAGNGADGANGEDGNHGAAPAKPGLNGNKGADACSMAVGLGGAAVQLVCEDGSTSHGGQGGNGGEGAANDGGDGMPAPNMNNVGYGAGGKGESLAPNSACIGGVNGAQGGNGLEGTGAVLPGKLTKSGFVGAPGLDGGQGFPGQGGGGGGASIGKPACGGVNGGAGGGSGGTGGCGGRGGKGGQGGGASIGVVSMSTEVYIYETRITTGDGGDGGNGGTAQAGGQGGLPGIGGAGLSAPDPVKKGCTGGAGGYGGDGGNGGGGRGGHSVFYAYTPGCQPNGAYPDYVVGVPGQGGFGGNQASVFGKGEKGASLVLEVP